MKDIQLNSFILPSTHTASAVLAIDLEVASMREGEFCEVRPELVGHWPKGRNPSAAAESC